MKKLRTALINCLFASLFGGGIEAYLLDGMDKEEEIRIEEITPDSCLQEQQEETLEWHTVTATYYHPVHSQCNGNPLITASGKKIEVDKLEKGHIKWIAVSRDLLGIFNFGDTVYLKCDHDPSIDGEYVIEDTMHKRMKRKIDLLWPVGKTGKGIWKEVRLAKKG